MTASEADDAGRNAAVRTGVRYDAGVRRQGKRSGRERGCWTYIPAEELIAAGVPTDPPPFYRTRGYQRSANGHTVIVSLYREP